MTVSIRASLLISALAMAALTAAFAAPPEHADSDSAHGPAPSGHAPATGPTAAPEPTPAAAPAHAPHWSYGGADGPEHWSELTSDNRPCSAGVQQSPVDLSGALDASVAKPTLAWRPLQAAEVVNNGHTLQVNVAGQGTLNLNGKSYQLKQFHFHHPSEHTIDGKSFPLEVHFVHAAADGDLAVVGVMFEAGAVNPALNPIWAVAPVREGKSESAGEIDLARFLPPSPSPLFRYEGSLTTPPCSETVHWTVLSTPIMASQSQLAAFAQLFPWNARPVQPLNRRYILKTSG